nr:alanine--tRNA ligase [Gammaproteobacteria bacterium]
MKTSNELRSAFLEYFGSHGHEVVASGSLIPANDPSLLFTNAGMVPFKEVFLGVDKRPYKRAASSQRCVRAGGKHNDLENVGYTARHHTFFEMLGNFSFGDYFKREAIAFAWELLTKNFAIPPERLWITVYEKDDEAADIWLKEIGVDPQRFSRCGDKDNFWAMGDTGPCGPCSEIFYDHGPEIIGGPPGSPTQEGDRYVEIWNLVFMQFNREPSGELKPLPRPSVDTGMGLERLAAVMQGVHSNYETDLFRHLIEAAAKITHTEDRSDHSLRVIADHIRSSSFLIVDGVFPSNEGRGYVLRRIIRRALRHGHKLRVRDPFFHRLVAVLEQEMGQAYPELKQRRELVERVLKQEEERFAETLDQGMHILEKSIQDLAASTIPGETLFRLYDTYGFPVDLTADIARERGLALDVEGFEREMAAQRERGRGASQFGPGWVEGLVAHTCSDFTGYTHLLEEGAEVVALYVDGTETQTLESGTEAVIVLDRTPFYPEAGGQVGDRGVLRTATARFEVSDTQRHGEAISHVGRLAAGRLRRGERVDAEVDASARQATARNHSATHLLHAALRSVLGAHVAQKGSLVGPDRLRFDFSHFEPVSPTALRQIERWVNAAILSDAEVATRVQPYQQALEGGALAFFGEKYGEEVRVLSIGKYSTELCGGTHVARAGEIGFFKIISETGVAAGVRRIEAVTGDNALEWVLAIDDTIGRLAHLIKSEPRGLEDKVTQLLARNRTLEKELERLQGKLAAAQGSELAAQALDVNGLRVLAARIDGIDPKGLRETVDQLKQKLGSAVVVLATVVGDKVSLVAGVTPDGTEHIAAGPLVNFVANQVGGRGGGRPDLAQAGGNDPSKLDQALRAVPAWVKDQLGS